MAYVDRSSSEEFFNGYEESLQGEISVPIVPGSNEEQGSFNTLDEPIKLTILRDLKAVGVKFFHVLVPKQKKALLRDWDLWGPLLLCIFLAMMLQEANDVNTSEGGLEFAEVFVVVWLGAFVVTINSKLLGGAISFFQSVCVLGYCLLPPALALLVCRILIAMAEQSTFLFILRFLITMLGFIWATFAAMVFLGDSQPPQKKALAVYPIFLFYFIISWMVISHTSGSAPT